MPRDATAEEVLAYLRDQHAPLDDLAAWTRAAVLTADPDLTERVYRGWRGIGFRHREGGLVCAIYPRGESVVLLFEYGAELADPDGILLGEGTQTRFLRVERPEPALRDRITRYVQQAIAERLLR
ncbi:MAG: DUF1801 domain-containing protein [Actinomycetota bacterium]|nr:DUF1801 domain-containing protein [Actinomycetota bacterium]